MRVLIVDDDQVTVEVVRDTVAWERLHIDEVFTANSAEKAREILTGNEIDIVISDIEMPRESGLDLLRWCRSQNYGGKFLLLTCHETFSYASDALRYHADEYLTKPFNVDIMEMTLQKITRELIQEKQEKDQRRWMEQQSREIRRSYMERLINGSVETDPEKTGEQLERLGIALTLEDRCRLVVCRLLKTEIEHSGYGSSFAEFLLEQLMREIICEGEEGTVMILRESGWINAAVLRKEADAEQLKKAADELIARVDAMTGMTVTVCVSEPAAVRELRDTYRRVNTVMQGSVALYGLAYRERDAVVQTGDDGPVLDMKYLDSLMEKRDRKGAMDYVKKEMDLRAKQRRLDRKVLEILQAEIRQSVYSWLSGRGVQVSYVLDTEKNARLAGVATSSVINMLKWINYLLGEAFAGEEKLTGNETIIDQIQAYVTAHYMEDIGRNEIGAQFYLVPEYVSKMYKKKTGVSLKDYINEYRIGQAKILLTDSAKSVGDIAIEVGFGNLSYFSTVFKKVTGMTPNEYRKQ